jgi:hypothetical protein
MQIQDFLRVYQEKSDEELLQLAAAGAELTSEATLALESELSRRGHRYWRRLALAVPIFADRILPAGNPSH